MSNITCPKCGNIFPIEQSVFENIASQVRNELFEKEVEKREKEIRKLFETEQENKTNKLLEEINILKLQIESKVQETEFELNKQFAQKVSDLRNDFIQKEASLKSLLERKDMEKALSLSNQKNEYDQILADKDKIFAKLESEKRAELAKFQNDKAAEISNLNHNIEDLKKQNQLQIANLMQQHAEQLSHRDQQIEYYKNYKLTMSTKMLGESLEQHCSQAFEQMRGYGLFMNAEFHKDNDVVDGTKGDFIFRDFYNGQEYISIMFEMKNEADQTATKHKNSDFLKKLDKDRKSKNCEYAVLVSMLEPESELYNNGIVSVEHIYPKMYVIRPNMFIPLISLLSKAAVKSMDTIQTLKLELERANEQNLDVTNFENRRNEFVSKFGKLVGDYRKKQEEALDNIDKVIMDLEKQANNLRKVRKLFETSQGKLEKANDAAENDFTIKKLTRGNPTMKRLFDEARNS